jgi:hypothetical protein
MYLLRRESLEPMLGTNVKWYLMLNSQLDELLEGQSKLFISRLIVA